MLREVMSLEFLQHLHNALTHFHELPFERTHPLCEMLNTSPPLTPAALYQLLETAFERLQPPPHVDPSAARWRHYRYLQLRYVDGVPVDRIGLALGVGDRQARREHHAALQELAAVLTQLVNQPFEAGEGDRPTSRDLVAESAAARWPRVGVPRSEGAALEAELSSLEAGPGPESLELVPMIEDAIRLVGPLAERRGIEIVLAPAHDQQWVVMTQTVLRQVLLIILNYFLGVEGIRRIVIGVSAEEGASQAYLMITDDRSVTVPAAGSSLDPPTLLVARRLLESQDGTLRVGRGTSNGIVLHLSLVTDDATLVVVVDDNPDLVRLFRRFLRGQGFRLLQVRAGRDAPHVIHATQPDVITLDLMMPVQDGWDLLDTLRHEPTTAKVPIIACSILPECDLALSRGATAFLAKPVSSEKLLAALAPFRRRVSRVPPSSI